MQVYDDCKKCGEHIDVNSVLQNKNFMKDGKSICLTYFDCPKCGERCFVQIDDEASLSMLASIKKTFTKFYYMKRQGKKISKKESSKFEKARANLGEYRTSLMKIYSGLTVLDKDNNREYVMRFFT